MGMNCVNPLVTVCVLTYESSDFVLETLESIKNQTYGNIQLIISDDSSKDSTVSVCQAWLERNMDRFASARIITAESNTGVTANCNRAVKNAEGRWIKLLAGDDILWHDALETLVSRAESLPYDRFFIGGFVQPFSDTQDLPRDTSRERELILLGGNTSLKHSDARIRFLLRQFFCLRRYSGSSVLTRPILLQRTIRCSFICLRLDIAISISRDLW